MLEILVLIHSVLRWFLLVGLGMVVINALIHRTALVMRESDRKIYVFTMIFFHVQLLLGLILYFLSTKVSFTVEMMKITTLRFYTLEHGLGMILAVALVTIGKKQADISRAPYKKLLFYYGLALFVTLISIPWPFRHLGAAWL